MAKVTKPELTVRSYGDHEIITQPNPLRGAVRRAGNHEVDDDPIDRAEQALEKLSREFKGWMTAEIARLAKAHTAIIESGVTEDAQSELYHAAHDIKGDAATFGYPTAGVIAASLCLLIEHGPDLAAVPQALIGNHIKAIQAIIRERAMGEVGPAEELARRLSAAAQAYLASVGPAKVKAPNLAPR